MGSAGKRRGAPVQLDPSPGIAARAARAGARRANLPGRAEQVGGDLRGGARGGRIDRQPAVTGDGEHVADAALLQAAGQSRVGAVDLVGGNPTGGDAGVQGAFDQRLSQRWLGREAAVGGHAGGRAAVRVVGPGARQVQLPVIIACPPREA